MSTNINLFKSAMYRNGYNISKTAELLGVPVSTVYRKLNNNGGIFTQKDLGRLIREWHLNGDEVNEIFFKNEVAQKQQESCV